MDELEEVTVCVFKHGDGYMASMTEDQCDVVGKTVAEALGNFMLHLNHLYKECGHTLELPQLVKILTFLSIKDCNLLIVSIV